MKDTTREHVVKLAKHILEHLAIVIVSSDLKSKLSTSLLVSKIIKQHLEMIENTIEEAIKNDTLLDDVVDKPYINQMAGEFFEVLFLL